MTTAARYRYFINNTLAAFTDPSLLPQDDGDDKLVRVFHKTFTSADIGNGAGQTGHASGVIVGKIPTGYNVLCMTGNTFRPGQPDNTVIVPKLYTVDDLCSLQQDGTSKNVTFHQAEINYFIDSSGVVRINDAAYSTADVRILKNDFSVITLILGQGVALTSNFDAT